MARRGKFGRLPRPAQDLTRTIVSIAREMQAQEDQNIMSAWQKGGSIDGQKVTDKMVLEHWRERLEGVDQDDPLYDTYKNTIKQYEYAIAESKASTAYAQGRMSDREMAQFYLNWSKKVPKRSEFWRVLQRDAAQFMQAAKAAGAASAAQAREQAYVNAQHHTEREYERGGQYITEVLTHMARKNALIGADPDSNLSQFDTHDPAVMLQLIETITAGTGPHRAEIGSDVELYRDPVTGKAVTGKDVMDRLGKLDPDFDGRMSLGYIRGLISRQQQGQAIRLRRAERNGKTTDANNIKGWMDYTGEVGREMNLWPVQQSYNTARQTFLATWASGTATPDAKVAAFREYAQTLTKLAAGEDVDDATRARLIAEVSGDGSVPSLAEDFTGLGSVDMTDPATGGFKGDIADTQFDLQRYLNMQQLVQAGQAFWTTGHTGEDGAFIVEPSGREIGAASYQEIVASSPVKPVVIFTPQGRGADPIPVLVAGREIKAFALNELGEKVALTDANSVGKFFDVTVGGQTTRVYSYEAADGKTYYTTSTPWDDRILPHPAGGGLELNLSDYVPVKGEDGAWRYANGEEANMDGSGPFGLSVPSAQGEQHLVMNPYRMTYSTDPARAAAGPSPMTDFLSPTVAALMSSPEGWRTLVDLQDDPTFKAQMAFEAQTYATDPTTGAIDPTRLAEYQGELASATALPKAADMVAFVLNGYSRYDRSSTAGTFKDAGPRTAAIGFGQYAGKQLPVEVAGLPSDQVRDTAFGALGSAFESGTNNFHKSVGGKSNGLRLELGPKIKVPEAPDIDIAPKAPPMPNVQDVATTVGNVVGGVVQHVTTSAPPTIGGPGGTNYQGTTKQKLIEEKTY